jgi:hypothetical protein
MERIINALWRRFRVCIDMVFSPDNEIYANAFSCNLCSDTDERLSWRATLSLRREAAHYFAQVSTDSLIIKVLSQNLKAEHFTLWLALRFNPVSALTVTYFLFLSEERYLEGDISFTSVVYSDKLKRWLYLRRCVAGISPRWPEFHPGPIHVGFVADEVAIVQVLLRVLRF